MRKRSRQRRPIGYSRRLALESLETRALLTAVSGVQVPLLPVESLDVVFSGPLDMEASSVSAAVTLHGISRGPVDSSSSSFTYDDAERTLTWNVGTALPQDTYELRLDGSLLIDESGEPLDGGSEGIRFQLPEFAASQSVQANGSDLVVNAFSVPSWADWNADGLLDLIVGQKTADGEGKIGIYLNTGTAESPEYGEPAFAQQQGADIAVVSQGCLGVYPRVFDWDGDQKKDLILGLADGRIQVFPNVNTDADPQFGAPSDVMVGPAGEKTGIDVGARAAFEIVDWNNDGRYDLIAGGFDGRVRVYANTADTRPADFATEAFVQAGDDDLVVPELRASVAVADLDGDTRKDLVLGDTAGQVLFYRNIGTDAAPAFGGFERIQADSQAIDLPEIPRSRPFVGDYNGDGNPDLLVGAKDGVVRLYDGLAWETPTTQPGPAGSPGDEFVFTFEVPAPPWQNPANSMDVNNDTKVSPIDVLQIINELNLHEYSDETGLLPPAPSAGAPPPFFDVNGDGYCAPGDALLLINFLNGEGESGEGEATWLVASSPAGPPDNAADVTAIRADRTHQPTPAASVESPTRQILDALEGPVVAVAESDFNQLITDLATDLAPFWHDT